MEYHPEMQYNLGMEILALFSDQNGWQTVAQQAFNIVFSSLFMCGLMPYLLYSVQTLH